MTNYSDLRLYMANNGEITRVENPADFDGTDTLLIAATSPEGAMLAAEDYDAGKIEIANLSWYGQTIACVAKRDPKTGNYA